MKNKRARYTVNELHKLKRKGRLNLQPAFQRKSIWNDEARAGLIDSIYRGYPVPEIFLWDSGGSKVESFEAIDGQQRLLAMLDFLDRKGFPSNGSMPFIMTEDDSIDIDEKEDLKRAEGLMGM